MAKPSWIWKESAEVLGVFAVLLGLIFVAFELRQNTNAIQAATLQGMVDISSNYLADTARDPDTMRLILNALENPDQLDDLESMQVRILLRSQWLRYQGAFRHWERESLGLEDWEVYKHFICGPEGSDYGNLQAYYWPTERYEFVDDFVSFVENCRSDLGP